MKNNLLKFMVCCLAWAACFTTASYAMGRIPKDQYNAKVAELDKCSRDSGDLKTQIDALQKSITEAQDKITGLNSKNEQLLKDMASDKSQLQQRVGALSKEKQDLEQQAAALVKEKETLAAEKQAEVEKLKGTYDDLVKDMKSEIDQGSIKITQLEDKLSVTLVDKVVFDSGESDLNKQGREVLKKVSKVLKNVKGKQIRIEGHTDNIPIGGSLKEKFPSNWELSTARATTVVRFLQDECGIDAKLLYAAGYSDFRPVADNATPEGRSKNRRIEINMVPLDAAPAKK